LYSSLGFLAVPGNLNLECRKKCPRYGRIAA
jgi:hypothetical protein